VICDPSDCRIKFDRISVNKALQKQLMLEHKFAYDGAVIEESIKSLECIRDISSFLDENSGSALFIDYGYYINSKERRREQYNSNQQAIKSHQYVSVIDTLGESDLTAHVDFFAMRKASVEHPISQSMFSTQREFLLKYGIEIRHTQLKKDKIPTDQNILDRQLYRLIDNSQMGELFKVLELFSPSKIEGD
jgi:SAM-dependent MidA family methyltransferase